MTAAEPAGAVIMCARRAHNKKESPPLCVGGKLSKERNNEGNKNQLAASVLTSASGPGLMHLTGHTPAQVPQPVHFS